MKKILLAFVFVSLLLLPGCARTGFSNDFGANWAYCKDTSASAPLKLKIERARCLHNLATLFYGNANAVLVCDDINTAKIGSGTFEFLDDAVTKNIRNDCYYEVAVRRAQDVKLDSATRYSAVSICSDNNKIKGDTVLGEQESGNMLLKDQCFYMVAVALLDETICNKISASAMKEDFKREPACPWRALDENDDIVEFSGLPQVPEDHRFIDLCRGEVILLKNGGVCP